MVRVHETESRTLFEEDVRLAKRRAVDEGRPLSHLIQDALETYVSTKVVAPAKCETAYQLFCERPIKLVPEHFTAVLEEDAWER